MATYRTSQIARIAGVHPNTVRLYEKWRFIPVAPREPNGYRVFTDVHVLQIQLVRAALEIEVLQAGLRKKMLDVVKLSAAGNYDEAMSLADEYISDVQRERANAEEAIKIVERLMRANEADGSTLLRRGEAAEALGITIDTLRNWELNGLLSVRRLQNGYRVYTESDMRVLKIIRALRCANYSLSSILRMLLNLPDASKAGIEAALDAPDCDDDVVTAYDRLLTSLAKAEENARTIIKTICELKKLR
ncbi:MerR family transcriptional regulator [Xiamenia xianingshaonis]|uniref:MerR family transcriptional regulator n=1 Tax=Xiamenia xianingshaonis TaxID=2682776 RepID=A0ABX0IPE9_9ACTN|nr:MerR family transcriptional regulator [Xiamenia xianingshaonis]NHM14732.1 MerR family transcriptional regulator [Xiamenia xianingshaonis]